MTAMLKKIYRENKHVNYITFETVLSREISKMLETITSFTGTFLNVLEISHKSWILLHTDCYSLYTYNITLFSTIFLVTKLLIRTKYITYLGQVVMLKKITLYNGTIHIAYTNKK